MSTGQCSYGGDWTAWSVRIRGVRRSGAPTPQINTLSLHDALPIFIKEVNFAGFVGFVPRDGRWPFGKFAVFGDLQGIRVSCGHGVVMNARWIVGGMRAGCKRSAHFTAFVAIARAGGGLVRVVRSDW